MGLLAGGLGNESSDMQDRTGEPCGTGSSTQPPMWAFPFHLFQPPRGSQALVSAAVDLPHGSAQARRGVLLLIFTAFC